MRNVSTQVMIEPSCVEEWYRWLSLRENEKKSLYLADHGNQLVADNNNEQGLTHDYEGREILELLQNAGDAAASAGVRGKVAIELRRDGIVVANTGAPFSSGGVNSLRTAHLSPKRLSKKLLVGEKGLGFRSILNWTSTPVISSGALQLVFSGQYTRRIYESLCANSLSLVENVDRYRKSENQILVPTLVFPAFSADGDVTEWLDTDCLRSTYALCLEYRKRGFDTAVGMPFRSENSFDIAITQLEELNPEFLLFVDSLAEISIQIEGDESPQLWRKENKENGQVTITSNGKVRGRWHVHDFGHESIPEEYVDEDGKEQDFQVVIAAPVDTDLRALRNRLFTYFPTNVEIPLPVLCHATLRLEANRNRPTASRANNYILKRLAEAIVKVAEKHTSKDDPWFGLRLLCASGAYPLELNRAAFPEALIAESSKRRLVPCFDGEFRCPGEAYFLKGATDDWLPRAHFSEVARHPDNEVDWKWLAALKMSELKAEEFERRLSSQTLTEDERVGLISGIIRNGLPKEFHISELLTDSTGKRIESGNSVFLSPNTDVPALPEWVKLRFLSAGMRQKLQISIVQDESRDLLQDLSEFGVMRFDRAAVVQRVVAEANRRCHENPEAEAKYRMELLQFLQTVFHHATKSDGDSFKFPTDARMELFNQVGSYKSAKSLYLSRNYGLPGTINQNLYESWMPENLVAPSEELGITGTAEELTAFLKWLGVAEYPREIRSTKYNWEFRTYVLATLDYPAKFGNDYTFNSPDEVEEFGVAEYQTLDGLDEILERSPAAAILGWLAADNRFAGWERRSAVHCKLTARRSGDWKSVVRFYQGEVPSYITWKIAYTAWLPNSTKNLLPPSDCLNAASRYELLFPRPADPFLSGDMNYGIQNSRDLFRAWDRAGVLPGLDRLEIDQIYEILLSMPDKSPDGAAARLLSRWLLENTDTGFGRHGSNYATFATCGMMWGKKGNHEGYFPVSELRFKGSESFPEEILHQYAIADLPSHRVGAKQVERLFHIKSLADETISQCVKDFIKAPMSDLENLRFQQVKPFLKRMRESTSIKADNLTALDRLDLILCDELTVRISAEGYDTVVEVAPWESILDAGNLFIKTDKTKGSKVSPGLLSNSLGVGIARLFGLKTGDAFANMYRCSAEERPILLSQMYGEESLAGLISNDQAEHELRNLPIYEVPLPNSRLSDSQTKGDTNPSQEEDEESLVAGVELMLITPDILNRIEVTSQPHSPESPRAPRRMIVRRESIGGGVKRSAHRVTDGVLCERLAFAFEEEQGRFPIAMDNITGTDGAGCDIFSFDSEETRSRFKSIVPREMTLVARFIEVKGRGDARAKIDLRGNEFDCARRESKRYFLYRFYESGSGDYSLTLLQDPIHQEEAISHSVTIDLEAASASLRYELSPAPQCQQAESVGTEKPHLRIP